MALANLDYVDVREVKLEFTEALVDGDSVGETLRLSSWLRPGFGEVAIVGSKAALALSARGLVGRSDW